MVVQFYHLEALTTTIISLLQAATLNLYSTIIRLMFVIITKAKLISIMVITIEGLNLFALEPRIKSKLIIAIKIIIIIMVNLV